MPPENKSAQVNLRFSPTLKAAAEAAAAAEHRSLASLIERLLAEYLQSEPTLEDWHDRAQAVLLSLLVDTKSAESIRGLGAKSYRIDGPEVVPIAAHILATRLSSIYSSLHDAFSYAPFLYPHQRPGLAPYFTSDRRLKTGKNEEILEAFGRADGSQEIWFWRVAPSGFVSDIRSFFEDNDGLKNNAGLKSLGLEHGKWFSPYFMVRELAAMIFHARALGVKIRGETVAFRCEWSGLTDRELGDAVPGYSWSPGKIAKVDTRFTEGEWLLEDIREKWPEIVSALGAPVLRLFDASFDCSPDWVRSQAPRFKS